MNKRVGIILAGGNGKRLFPITKYVCKQLLPVYNKPMIYYPLYTLMKMGIKDILIISTPETTPILEKSLGNGNEYNCKFLYKIQEKPNGIAQAFVLGKEFIGKNKVCLILGDNIFYGN
jgi:glucose-1-phosphate thymidylyltransferase